MLLILILAAWLAVTALVVAVCRSAAYGDSTRASGDQDPGRLLAEGLRVWGDTAELALMLASPARRDRSPAFGSAAHATARRQRIVPHPGR